MDLSELQRLKQYKINEESSRYEEVMPEIKEKIFAYLEQLNSSPEYEILYRGTNFNYIKYKKTDINQIDLLKRVFVVGDKAKRFFCEKLKDVLDNTILESQLETFENIDPATILGRLSSDYFQRNKELRALIHYLNKEQRGYDIKGDSFVSTSSSFSVASEFASKNYIIVVFEDKKQIFNVERLKTIVGEEASELIDYESEYMVNQAIFPNKIIGIIDGSKRFIINHWLVKKLELSEEISNFEIPVDQTLFDKYKKDFGYQNETYDNYRGT